MRQHDFLTPPSDAVLNEIRKKAASSVPPADHPDALGEEAAPKSTTVAVPMIDLGDFARAPKLAEYRKDASMGADSLVDLAERLEAAGQAQRALLAWERVLDSAPAQEAQTLAAITAVQRLRSGLSDWKAMPEDAIAITLHAGTGKTTAALLEPVLTQIASEMSQSSAGILKISAKVAAGNDIPESLGPPPVALWFAGEGEEPLSTEILSFTVGAPENLRADVLATLSKLLRGYLARTSSLTIPEVSAPDGTPETSSTPHITRLAWRELGTRLTRVRK